jgi:hypothetical protein
MIPNMPILGVRFDINMIESGTYGLECWKVFWRCIDIDYRLERGKNEQREKSR